MSGNDLIPVNELLHHVLTYSKGKLKWKLETLPPELLELSAEELEEDQKITETDQKLRLLFHQELERATEANEAMVMTNICKGVCHTNSLLLKFDDPKKLAWMLVPYQHENIRIQHQVTKAHDAIETLLNLDITYKDPKTGLKFIDHKAAELKWKAAKLIYDRAYPATQKVQYSKDKNEAQQLESVDDRIKLLEEKLRKK